MSQSTVIKLDIERAVRRPTRRVSLDDSLADAADRLRHLHKQVTDTLVIESDAIDQQVADLLGIITSCQMRRVRPDRQQA